MTYALDINRNQNASGQIEQLIEQLQVYLDDISLYTSDSDKSLVNIPSIDKTTGNWIIGGKDTGVAAKGETINAEFINAEHITSGDINTARMTANAIAAINAYLGSAVINSGKIEDLDAGKITSGDIDTERLSANIINAIESNSQTSWITNAMLGKAIIESANIKSLSGDVIDSGTIATERLIIKDPANNTGILWAINDGVVSQQGLTADQLKRLTLNGKLITAHTITADEIYTNSITVGCLSQGVQDSITGAQDTADSALLSANTNATDLTNYINATNRELTDLQGQIDGSITTWFYEYDPSDSNIPASGWTTTELKNNHLGDLFYNTITGYCYRYQVQSNVYSWVRITDVDVTKALSDAAKAQDTADSKRRVFTGTNGPTPPYDIGDLWAQGDTQTSGDLLRCNTAKTAGQSYLSSDWGLATNYKTKITATNAAAVAAQEAADTAQTSADTAQTAADNAQISANSKSKTFTGIPTPPYSIGDIWVQTGEATENLSGTIMSTKNSSGENLKSLVVNGSTPNPGTQSPSAPITLGKVGSAENVNVTGKNLLNIDNRTVGYGNTGKRNIYAKELLPLATGNYTFSCDAINNSAVSGQAVYLSYSMYDVTGTTVESRATGYNTLDIGQSGKLKCNFNYIKGRKVTLYVNYNYDLVSADTASAFVLSNFLCELGTLSTPTTYEPYSGTAYPIGRDMYRWDTKDLISGAVSVGHGIKVLDGTEDWVLFGSNYPNLFTLRNLCGFEKNNYDIFSTHYMSWNNSHNYSSNNFIYTTGIAININSLSYINVSDFKAFLAAQYAAGTPVTIIGKAATPTTATDTAQSISTPAGNMVVSSDSALAPTLAAESVINKGGQIMHAIAAEAETGEFLLSDWSISELNKDLKDSIDATNAHLADNYYTKDDTDAAALQTAADIAAAAQAAADAAAAAGQASDKSDSQYADLLQNINDVSDTNSGKWDNLENRITMDSTGINIAVDDANGSSLKLTGNRISFRQGGTEVAYIEGKKLVIESGVFMKSLEVNGFAWTPRSNGNLSFGKAVS